MLVLVLLLQANMQHLVALLCSHVYWQLRCVAETAAWDAKTGGTPMCNDTMYVMIYDGAAVMSKSNLEEYKQGDGLGRTIHSFRFEDFANWQHLATYLQVSAQ